MNTTDMHPFIHPLSAAVDPVWESRTDWEIYKDIAKTFSTLCVGHLGQETDVVLQPIQHDSPAELAQPYEIKEWHKGECDLIPGKTAPNIIVVERDYPATGIALPLSARCWRKSATAAKGSTGRRRTKWNCCAS